MNLDRLLKLLKLANHNSNDAEANSAARAASKLLGEENYKWLEDAKRNGGRPPASKNGRPTYNEWFDPATNTYNIKISQVDIAANKRIADLVIALEREVKGAGTWNDVHRSKEPQWRSTPPPPPEDDPFDWANWNPFDNFDFDAFNREHQRRQANYERTYREARTKREEERKEQSRKAKEKSAQSWTWTGERSGDKGYKKVYKQQCRDCTVCNITRLTVDEETPYICYECKRKV